MCGLLLVGPISARDQYGLRIANGYAKSVTMPTDVTKPAAGNPQEGDKRPLSPAAGRALAEAAERRAARQESRTAPSEEIGGRGGLDPTRYGDWEINGIAADF